jgi:phosphate-selective porin
MKNKIFILTFFLAQISFGQYVNIVPQLQEIETGNIEDVNTVNILNIEAVYSIGPFTAQAEYLSDFAHQENAEVSQTYQFANYYAQVSFFITGEHRPYIDSYETFGRVKPHKNVVVVVQEHLK